jgi:hypothetical protein
MKAHLAYLGNVRAHDTRRCSTSWALFKGASIQEIIQTAHWAFDTTFTSFYLKDVCSEDSFARASLLETAHWARKKSRKQAVGEWLISFINNLSLLPFSYSTNSVSCK